MGLFLVSMAISILVVQATLILSNREPNQWVFLLLQPQSSAFENTTENYHGDMKTPFTECIEMVKANGKDNFDICRLWYHNRQENASIFNDATWNPHIILLVISSIHFIFCFSNAKQHYTDSSKSNEFSSRIYQFPSSVCLCILFLTCLVVALVSSNRNHSLEPYKEIFDTPSILVSVFLFIAASWFLKIKNDYTKSQLLIEKNSNIIHQNWVLVYQLQFIGVPLTTLMISVMGVRIFTDIITHIVLLSVSVNTLWLYNTIVLSDTSSDLLLTITRMFTVSMPLFSITMAQTQWGGANTWQHLTAYMAFVSLAPVFLFPFLSSHEYGKKILLRLGSYCTTAALGCTVINLALL